jgi:hypothetical protein
MVSRVCLFKEINTKPKIHITQQIINLLIIIIII